MNLQNAEICPEETEIPEGAGLPALQTEISTIIEARDAALATMEGAAQGLNAAYALADKAQTMASRAHMGRRFYGAQRDQSSAYERLFKNRFDSEASMTVYRKDTDAAIWTYLLERTGLRDMMDVDAIKAWENDMRENVTEVTFENLRATFQTMLGEADLIFQRGLANAFSKLDRRFKSHGGFKLGSRIILERVFDSFSGSWSYGDHRRETISDIERVFAKLDGSAPDAAGLFHSVELSRGGGWDPRQSTCETRYFKIRGFKNGNAHLWFTRDDLVEKANKLLAEYYGEVIPDAAPADAEPEQFKSGALVPTKDLQFYATPEAVQDRLIKEIYWKPGMRVLEPSAGTGHLVKRIREKGAHVTAIEIYPDRVKQLRNLESSYCDVFEGNFLTYPANGSFDAVVMNPPFYGTHWIDHIRHAWDCLKEGGGTLVSVLPISAELGQSAKHITFRRWTEKVSRGFSYRLFQDLPAESFAMAGTRINTVILTMRK